MNRGNMYNPTRIKIVFEVHLEGSGACLQGIFFFFALYS